MDELPIESKVEPVQKSGQFDAEPAETHYRRDDDRWSAGRQVRDWIILIAMIVIYLTWTGLIYLLEPGIR